MSVVETLTRATTSHNSNFEFISRMRSDMLLLLSRSFEDELANEFGVAWPLKLYWRHSSDRNLIEANGLITVETSNPEQLGLIKGRLEHLAEDLNFNLIFTEN